MDSNLQDSQNPDSKPQSIIPFTSITLSIPKFLIPTHFKSPPKILSFSLKIPSSLNLSLTPTHPTSKSLIKSKISSNPLQIQLPINPTRRNDPPTAAGLRRVSVVWFRSDLRIQDNESLNSANNESLSVLPVYCFDSKLFGKFSSGFDKIGINEASFLIESVSDLRNSLRAKGSDLIVRIGKPETVLAELVKQVGAESVYVHREVNNEEVKNERKIENVLKDEGVEVKYFWGSTLFHIDDLPFKLDEMPSEYGGFKEKLKGVKVRKTIEVTDQMKGLPSSGNVEVGEIPSLGDLGFNPTANMTPV